MHDWFWLHRTEVFNHGIQLSAHTTGCTWFGAGYESASMSSARIHWLHRNSLAVYFRVTHRGIQRRTNNINSLIAPSLYVHASTHQFTHTSLSGVRVCALTAKSADGSGQPCATLTLCQRIKGNSLVRPQAGPTPYCYHPRRLSHSWAIIIPLTHSDWTKLHLVSALKCKSFLFFFFF